MPRDLTYLAAMAPRESPPPATRIAAAAIKRGVPHDQFISILEPLIKRRTMERYWAGETEPRLSDITIICRALDVSADYLAGLIEKPAPLSGHPRSPAVAAETAVRKAVALMVEEGLATVGREARAKAANRRQRTQAQHGKARPAR